MTNNEQRALGDIRIFQAVFNDLGMKHELVQLADGSNVWAYTYEGVDPYELDDSHFPTITNAIAEERAKAAREARIEMAEKYLLWECQAGYQDQDAHIRAAQNSLDRLKTELQSQESGENV